jgi:nucleoside-diphosphate-sugar epimerase
MDKILVTGADGFIGVDFRIIQGRKGSIFSE